MRTSFNHYWLWEAHVQGGTTLSRGGTSGRQNHLSNGCSHACHMRVGKKKWMESAVDHSDLIGYIGRDVPRKWAATLFTHPLNPCSFFFLSSHRPKDSERMGSDIDAKTKSSLAPEDPMSAGTVDQIIAKDIVANDDNERHEDPENPSTEGGKKKKTASYFNVVFSGFALLSDGYQSGMNTCSALSMMMMIFA